MYDRRQIQTANSAYQLLKQARHELDRLSDERAHVTIARAATPPSVTEMQRYSVAEVLKHEYFRIIGGRPEGHGVSLARDVSDELARQHARPANGFYVPIQVLSRDFSAGTANEAGNTIAGPVAGLTTMPRARIVLGKLGVTFGTATATIDAPRFATLPAGESRTEVQQASDGSGTTAAKELGPTRFAAKFRVSRQALIQAPALVDATFTEEMRRQIMVPVEAAAIAGVLADNGVPTVAINTNGGAMTRAKLVELESTVGDAGGETGGPAGFCTNPKVRSHLRRTESASGNGFLWPDELQGPLNYPAGVTSGVPSNLTKAAGSNLSAMVYGADWSALWLVFFGPAAIDVWIDPVTRADTGEVIVYAEAHVGSGVVRPASFAKVVDIVTT